MSASIGSDILRQDDGAWAATWAPFTLRSAFQPIFAFEKGKLSIVAFEALLRPFRNGSPTAPLAFLGELPTTERIFVENLSHKMHLLNAAAYLPGDAEIFINFDPSIFIDHAVAVTAIREMKATLAKISVAPQRVVCELTERETVSEEILFALVDSLKASGFRIAIDDFGADESDMGRVRDLRPDIVKFDGEWVSRLMVSGPGLALLSTMVSTFAEQGIRTLFEGIEEGWQIELAEKTGVELVQGFALARPEIVPASFVAAKPEGVSEPHFRNPPSLVLLPKTHAVGELRQSKSFGRRTS
ncbi:MAG: EAL domain-containing protein [Mesorhizobium sp.]|nr:EAL domain-containing protein [Mesorhizobium sp.]MBL8577052.1 EAL domain-containing protein [Mesorhizobium sp.]